MPYLKQTVGLAIYYALKDPSQRISILLAIFFIICPALIFTALFAKKMPRTWLYFIALNFLLILIVPVGHYMITMVPFLAMLAADAFEEDRVPRYLYVAILLIPTLRWTAGALVSPWGAFGRRQYGLMDMYYEADVVKKLNLKQPVWTSWPSIYFINGWPLVGNSFIDLMQGGENIDWTKKPYCDVQTRLYFYSSADHGPFFKAVYAKASPTDRKPTESWDGWTFEDIPLTRGQYHWVRVWRKND